jgi:NAD(P)-dependent dehydrogenase (short-subunit alcohol dehydrogenase family)
MERRRRVVVTGGTAGIGLAIAQRLGERGDRVFVCGRNDERLVRAIEQISEVSPDVKVSGTVCDVRNLCSVTPMLAEACDYLGGIDVLVNSAGVGSVTELEEMAPKNWAEMIDINLTGVFNCCSAALPYLKEAAALRGAADIVNLGSRSGRYAFKGGVGYNATKFGVQGMTEAMFLDLNQFGIRAGLVAPGTVSTGFAGAAPEQWHLTAQDVADAVEAMINARVGACINWIELRPSRPPQ